MEQHNAFVIYEDEKPPRYGNVLITVDSLVDKETKLYYIIHELLHLEFWNYTKDQWVSRELEEVMVSSLQTHLMAFIRKSPRRLAGWKKTIDKKLSEE